MLESFDHATSNDVDLAALTAHDGGFDHSSGDLAADRGPPPGATPFDEFLFSSSSLTATSGHGGAAAADHDEALRLDASAAPAHAKAAEFDPSKFSLHPKKLAGDAETLADAINGGYSASKALSLLEKQAGKAHVSYDQMLLLTEGKLDHLDGAHAAAGKKAFIAEMKTELSSGDALDNVGSLINAGKLNGVDGADILAGMAGIATPGVDHQAHLLAGLLDKLGNLKVSEAQIEAIARHDAKLIVDGLALEIGTGGKDAPKATDTRAAAEVLEGGLVKFSNSALVKIETEFARVDDTKSGLTLLHQIEAAALKEAVSEHQLSKAEAAKWDKAFNPPKLDSYSRTIYDIASQYHDGKISINTAEQELEQVASDYTVAHGGFNLYGDLIVKASTYTIVTTSQAGDLAKLVHDVFAVATELDSSDLKPILTNLLNDVMKGHPGDEVDPKALVEIALADLGLGTLKETQIRADFKVAAKAAGDDFIPWSLNAIGELGGQSGILSSVASIKVYLAIADRMADLVPSGAVADYAAAEVKSGDMSVAKAAEFVMNFASFAMDNNGSADYVGSDGAIFIDGNLTQVDGVRAGDRADLALVQLVKSFHGKLADQATTYATGHHMLGYLDGLGEYGMLMGGDILARSLVEARDLITTSVTADVAVLSKAGATNTDMLAQAKTEVDTMSGQYLDGINLLGDVAQLALGDHAPFGIGSLGDLAAFASDPSTDALVKLGDSITVEVLDISNPLGKAQMIGNLADAILDKFGVAEIIGPFLTNVVEGTIHVIDTVGGAIDDAIDAAVGIVTAPLVAGAEVVADAAKNFGNFIGNLVTGDWSGVAAAAEEFGKEFADDTINAGIDLAGSVLDSIHAVIDAANTLVEAAQAVAHAIADALNAIADGIDDFFAPFFGGR